MFVWLSPSLIVLISALVAMVVFNFFVTLWVFAELNRVRSGVMDIQSNLDAVGGD